MKTPIAVAGISAALAWGGACAKPLPRAGPETGREIVVQPPSVASVSRTSSVTESFDVEVDASGAGVGIDEARTAYGVGTQPKGPIPPTAPASAGSLRSPPRLERPGKLECPFPDEADEDGDDSVTVRLIVIVDKQGKPQKVSALNDPGHGFVRAARHCLLMQSYEPAIGVDGTLQTAATAPITVTFHR